MGSAVAAGRGKNVEGENARGNAPEVTLKRRVIGFASGQDRTGDGRAVLAEALIVRHGKVLRGCRLRAIGRRRVLNFLFAAGHEDVVTWTSFCGCHFLDAPYPPASLASAV